MPTATTGKYVLLALAALALANRVPQARQLIQGPPQGFFARLFG